MSRRIDNPRPGDVLDAIVRHCLERIAGVRVGRVLAWNDAQRTADVQPVRRRKIWGAPQDLPPLLSVPVGLWRAGGMVLHCALEPGDEVLLVTCEREVWPWYATGQPHDPQSERMHDATDTIALPWLSAITRVVTARQPGTLWLGREDASAGITITTGPLPGTTTVEGTGPGSIVLGSAASQTVTLYPPLASALAAFTASVISAGGTVASGVPPGSSAPDPTGALYTTYAAAITTAATTLQTAAANAAVMGTIKVVAE